MPMVYNGNMLKTQPKSMDDQLGRLAKAYQLYLQRTKGSNMTKTTKTTKRILPDLAAAKRIKELEAKVAELSNRGPALSIKVSSKGGVSLYGLGRFPVTLYKSQWDRVIEMVPEIQAFIKKNESKLAVKE